MTSQGDQLVEEYLRRFDNASVFLTEERRAELRQEIVEHISADTEEAEAVHADAVRAALERLGPPADIVASETGSGATDSTQVLGHDSPSLGSTAHEDDGRLPPGGASAPAPPARPRRLALVLIGAVAAAVVFGFLVLATSITAGDDVQPDRAPSVTRPPGGAPDSEGLERSPSDSPDASRSSSQEPTPSTDTPTTTP